MKRLILIPLLLISAFCFSQTIDTLLGVKGKLIKDTSTTIVGNYLFTPSRNHLSFDSSKLGWIWVGNKLYTKIQQVGIGAVPIAKLMISDSTGSVSNNDSTGIYLTNDTTSYSPPLTFNSKALNATSGTWQHVTFRMFSFNGGGNPNVGAWHLQKSINGGAYSDLLSINSGGPVTFAGNISATGTSTFTTGVTTAQLVGTYLFLTNSNNAAYGVTQSSSYSSGNGGGVNIAPTINGGLSTPYAWKGIYVNPSVTNYPNIDLVGFQNEMGRNLLNSREDNTGIGVTTIDHSAKLQVGGTAQGVLFPVMTQSQRDSMARPVSSVTITNGGTGYASTTTGQVTFSAGAIRAKGQYTASGGVITSVAITEVGAYGAGQTPVTVTFSSGSATATVNLGASAPATGLTVFCSDCTATDASTGVYQTWNGSTWKNWW